MTWVKGPALSTRSTALTALETMSLAIAGGPYRRSRIEIVKAMSISHIKVSLSLWPIGLRELAYRPGHFAPGSTQVGRLSAP